MARKTDQIIVIDIEATCWEGDPPPGQESEIIEIGVCLLDVKTAQRSLKQSILVRPERSQVSPFCTQLTTLRQEQVDTGISFEKAVSQLRRDYDPRDRVWASYGDYDRIQFQRQCEVQGVRYPFSRTHLNVKNLLAIGLNLPYEVGLDRGLALLDLSMEGTHHRGDDDAWNIAAVLSVLLDRIQSRQGKTHDF